MQTRYQVSGHPEKGAFESMTNAILWAYANLANWDGKVELLAGEPQPARDPHPAPGNLAGE